MLIATTNYFLHIPSASVFCSNFSFVTSQILDSSGTKNNVPTPMNFAARRCQDIPKIDIEMVEKMVVHPSLSPEQKNK